MGPKIERITESIRLGEGPHWHIPSQTLYFVDCWGQRLMRYNPKTKKLTGVSTAPKRAHFVIPVEGKNDQFIISLENELIIISWDGTSDKFSIVEKLCAVDGEKPGNRFNDAKCDSTGRLWSGTMCLDGSNIDEMKPVGTLYSFDSKRQLKSHESQLRLSNGIAFNEQEKRMYYIDSLKRTVDQFDFDVVNGTLSNRRVLFTLKKNNIPGFPDGMTIDTDGNLWVAIFGASRIIRIDGKQPETVLYTLSIPAVQITSVSFGGSNLDDLYVTTAAIEYGGQKVPPPENGATYRITGLGSRGFPANNFKIN